MSYLPRIADRMHCLLGGRPSQRAVPRKRLSQRWPLRLPDVLALGALLLCSPFIQAPSQAQIVADPSVGTAVANGPFCGFGPCTITGGMKRGSTLFHSFESFTLFPNREVAFQNDHAMVRNIVSRVTGMNPSVIRGTISASGTEPNFNLFLINPQGIVFHPTAQLNLNGSFLASTAESIVLGDGSFYSASNLDPPSPTLTMSVPVGLQFGASAAAIEVRGAALDVPLDSTLGLVGGPVTVNQGGVLSAPGGRLELGGVGPGSRVAIAHPTPLQVSLDYPGVPAFRDIQLSGQATASAIGGNLQAQGQNVILQEGATFDVTPSFAESAGTLKVVAAESVQLLGGVPAPGGFQPSGLVTRNTGTPTRTGDIDVTANQVFLRDGAEINSSVFGTMAGGTISIRATRVDLEGTAPDGRASGIFAATSGGTAQGGKIAIETDQLVLRQGTTLSTSSTGAGNAGDIEVMARSVALDGQSQVAATTLQSRGGNIQFQQLESLTLAGGSRILTSTQDGQGGTIDIQAPGGTLRLQQDSDILARASGGGIAGEIRLDAAQLNLEDGSQVAASSLGGTAGDLEIVVNTVTLDDRARLATDTLSSRGGDIRFAGLSHLTLDRNSQISASTVNGRGGNLEIDAAGGTVRLDRGSGLFARASGQGTAGNIRLGTAQLTLEHGAQAATSSVSGAAGDLEIVADTVMLNDGAVLATESLSAQGGDIQLRALDSVTLDNSSRISASTVEGSAGSVDVLAPDFITVARDSGISSESSGRGDAGSVVLATWGPLNVRDRAQVTVSSTGTGNAGDLEIEASDIFLTNQGRLAATTASGQGGNIHLTVKDNIILRFNSEISAEAGGTGDGGNITIDAGGFIIAVLPENSDIVANAFQGSGGSIFARATGVFGFRQFRGRRTPQSDFTASSELGIDGTVTLDVRDFQPDVLPAEQPVEANIGQGCQTQGIAGSGQSGSSRFIRTGRGGIAANPTQALSSNTIRVPWVELGPTTGRQHRRERLGKNRGTVNDSEGGDLRSDRIVEAKYWFRLSNGDIVLTARDPSSRLSISCWAGR